MNRIAIRTKSRRQMRQGKKKRGWLSENEYRNIYGKKVPRLCVELIACTVMSAKNSKRNPAIMIVKRGIPPRKGYWHVPGVTILRGETVQSALLRCAREELGVKLRRNEKTGLLSRFLGYWEYPKEDGFGQAVSLVFAVEVERHLSGGEIKSEAGIPKEEVRVVNELPKPFIPSQRWMLRTLWIARTEKRSNS